MQIPFYKYQGTGNDFVIIDNRQNIFPKNNTKLVAQMCDRKFGIGADGLLLLEHTPEAQFLMIYYNSDGNLSSMCGNGGRCICHFAQYLGIINNQVNFLAVDGLHQAILENDKVSLKMNNVDKISVLNHHVFLNTGSPHHVELVEDIDTFNVYEEGKKIRNEIYGTEGANVNFVENVNENTFKVRTYERGVENETLSCGTGVTAVAIAMYETQLTQNNHIKLITPGGDLEVTFIKEKNNYKNIYLIGPAVQVYKGLWTVR